MLIKAEDGKRREKKKEGRDQGRERRGRGIVTVYL
jgi:hypothetical protein